VLCRRWPASLFHALWSGYWLSSQHCYTGEDHQPQQLKGWQIKFLWVALLTLLPSLDVPFRPGPLTCAALYGVEYGSMVKVCTCNTPPPPNAADC
jgi:hypothetical protein